MNNIFYTKFFSKETLPKTKAEKLSFYIVRTIQVIDNVLKNYDDLHIFRHLVIGKGEHIDITNINEEIYNKIVSKCDNILSKKDTNDMYIEIWIGHLDYHIINKMDTKYEKNLSATRSIMRFNIKSTKDYEYIYEFLTEYLEQINDIISIFKYDLNNYTKNYIINNINKRR